MSEEEAKELLGHDNIGTWNKVVESITTFLTSLNLTWYSVSHPEFGPNHLGWSRIATESHNAKNTTNFSRPPKIPGEEIQMKGHGLQLACLTTVIHVGIIFTKIKAD